MKSLIVVSLVVHLFILRFNRSRLISVIQKYLQLVQNPLMRRFSICFLDNIQTPFKIIIDILQFVRNILFLISLRDGSNFNALGETLGGIAYVCIFRNQILPILLFLSSFMVNILRAICFLTTNLIISDFALGVEKNILLS